MSIIKRTTAVQWLFEELNKEIHISERMKEIFNQAQEYERECIEDAYMANRRNMEQDEATTYYIVNYHA